MRERVLGNLTRRRVLVALVLVAAGLGCTIVYTQAAKTTTTYRTALVTYGTITQTIGMAGNLAPVSEADLNFSSAGTVQTVYAQVGQSVGIGAPLATLDTTLLSAELQQAQATLASAQAKRSQDLEGPTSQNPDLGPELGELGAGLREQRDNQPGRHAGAKRSVGERSAGRRERRTESS